MQYDENKLVEYFADAPAGVGFSDLDLNNIPHHISCIMDGNGRWATVRGLARTEGHKAGIVSLREIITACVRLGVDVLSAYAFSTENWNRPQHEVNVLMHLFAKTFIDELPLLKRENVRVVFLGDISALPKKTRDVFECGLAECADHTGMTPVSLRSMPPPARSTLLLSTMIWLLRTCTPPVFPIPSWSFAPPASYAFRTICCGRWLIPSSMSPIPIGLTLIVGALSTPFWPIRAVTVGLVD